MASANGWGRGSDGPSAGRDVTAAAITAFLRETLDDDAGAHAYLAEPVMAGVTVDTASK